MSTNAAEVVAPMSRKVNALPPREFLEECFEYNPETGDLTWKERPLWHFKSINACNRHKTMLVGKVAGYKNFAKEKQRRAYIGICMPFNGKVVTLVAHTVIWILLGRDIPDGMQVDHRNGDAWDNRLINLRLSTHKQNSYNVRRRRDKKDDLPKGVGRKRGKFHAKICKDGEHIWLGTFSAPEAAEQAYKEAAQRLFGGFANHLSR